MTFLRHLHLLRPVATAILVVINVSHPFLHPFEGGALDAVLQYVNLWAVTTATTT